MSKRNRGDEVTESLARWAMDFRSVEHHDADQVARIAGLEITVGVLRRAFERHFGVSFHTGQAVAPRLRLIEGSAGGVEPVSQPGGQSRQVLDPAGEPRPVRQAAGFVS